MGGLGGEGARALGRRWGHLLWKKKIEKWEKALGSRRKGKKGICQWSRRRVGRASLG